MLKDRFEEFVVAIPVNPMTPNLAFCLCLLYGFVALVLAIPYQYLFTHLMRPNI